MNTNHSNRSRHSQRRHWNRRDFLSAIGAGALGTTFLGGLGGLAPRIARATEGSRFAKLEMAVSEGGVIASISPIATAVGIEVLNRGGNAVDAAVATVFVLGVARPEMCGIGGCGMLLYRSAAGETAALDFQGPAPANFPPDVFDGPGMHKDPTVFFGMEGSGHRVVGVPGVVAGMAAALARYGSGRFAWADLIAPAEVLAREGVEMTDELVLFIFLEKERLSYYKETAETYLPYDALGARGGAVVEGGVPIERYKLIQEQYAASLRLLIDGGPGAFYRGPIAELIADDMARAEENAAVNPVLQAFGPVKWGGASNDKGFIAYDDLAAYQAVWREPITINYRGHQVVTMPPSGSGVLIAEMLNLLEGFDLAGFGHSSADRLHVLAEAQKIAYADRELYIADPDFYEEVAFNVEVLTSKDYARRRRAEIDMDQARLYEGGEISHGAHTNHMSAIDREGNAVAVTTTQGFPFGSVVMAPGTGFVLNDQLFDWVGRGGIDQPLAGARTRTNMSPTLVVRKGKPVLVTGAAGGNAIPMGIVQQVLNVVDFGMGVDQAIDAERMDAVNASLTEAGACSGFVSPLAIESGGSRPLDPAVRADLESRRHEVQERAEYEGLPNVQSAGVDLATGLRIAASDPRGEGGADGQ